jgi:hypothetical protein
MEIPELVQVGWHELRKGHSQMSPKWKDVRLGTGDDPFYRVKPKDGGFRIFDLKDGFPVGPMFAFLEEAEQFFETTDVWTDTNRTERLQNTVEGEVDKHVNDLIRAITILISSPGIAFAGADTIHSFCLNQLARRRLISSGGTTLLVFFLLLVRVNRIVRYLSPRKMNQHTPAATRNNTK